MKTSVAGIARAAQRDDKKLRNTDGGGIRPVATMDSFVNFAAKLGIGSDNLLSAGSYGFNPITRNRNLLEWIHRGSWLGGVSVDVVADDMTRAGVEFINELDPTDAELIEQKATDCNLWGSIAETIQWGRLYGGALAVVLIDGQDMKTPLRPETVGKDQFKGFLVLDRWMADPTLNDLVTELGPQLGLPKFYRITSNAPALRNQTIHYSRVMVRHTGVKIPYQQRLTENLWGISVLERLYDRMVAFDSASMGAAQLVYKSYLRTLKLKGLRALVAQGGDAMKGLATYVNMMQRYQSNEGISMVDMDDEFEVQAQGMSGMSGISDVIMMLAQQIAGALRIPITRLLGRSPAGLNATGESDERIYYDGIRQDQQRDLHHGVTLSYRMIAASEGIKLPDNFAVGFRSLWQLTDAEKAEAAGKTSTAIGDMFDKGIIGRKTALSELRQTSRTTSLFSNITTEMIEAADDEPPPPAGELAMQGLEQEKDLSESGQQHEKDMTKSGQQHEKVMAKGAQQHQAKLAKSSAQQKKPGTKDGGRQRVSLDFWVG